MHYAVLSGTSDVIGLKSLRDEVKLDSLAWKENPATEKGTIFQTGPQLEVGLPIDDEDFSNLKFKLN